MTIEYHEPPSELSARTRDLHRAYCSVVEEFEAIDWYEHRLDVTEDEELRSLIKHNQDEECEHAAMALEWLRRRVPALDAQLRKYLFTEGPLTEVGHGEAKGNTDGSLGLAKATKGEKA